MDELPEGERKLITVGKRSIGVFNNGNGYYALLNKCPHQFAPLCQGRISGTTSPGAVGEFNWEREGEIIRCPWHGWEFDLTNGQSVFNPHRCRVKAYKVLVANGSGEPTEREVGEDEDDPNVETFPVKESSGWICVEV